VIAQNQNHFRNQGVEIVQKLSILCKQGNQCRPVLSVMYSCRCGSYANNRSMHGRRQFVVSNATL
jgi:hypothetical protein